MKMKRIAAAMLATVMAVSLSACGTNSVSTVSEDTGEVQVKTERTDNEKPDSDDSATSAVTDAPEQTEQTEQTTTTTAPEEPEVPVELPLMNAEPRLIMNGCMAFKCDGKNYVYNITDNELYETEYDVDDITVLNGCVAIVGDISHNSFDDDYSRDDHVPYVVNLKTHELYEDILNSACCPLGRDIVSRFWGNCADIVSADKQRTTAFSEQNKKLTIGFVKPNVSKC